MSKLKYGVASIAVAAMIIGGLPYIVKNSIDTIIEKEKNELSSKGMELKVMSHTGYFESTRKINIEFTDSIKMLDYMAEITNLDIETVRELTNNGLIFSDISFKAIVTNSNLFSQTIKTKISLDKLPLELQNKMEQDKQLDSFIKSLLLNIDFDMEGKVTFVSLNDIIIKENDVEVKVIKPELTIAKDIYNTRIQNITFNVNQDDEYTLLYLDDINDTLRYTDEFDFEEKANIATMKFHYKNKYSGADVQYESSNNLIQTNANIQEENLNVSLGYDINDLVFRMQSTDTQIDKFVFNIDFNEIKEKPLRVLNDSFTNEYEFARILVPNVQEIVNEGFKINIASKINNLTNVNVSAKEIGMDLKFALAKNTLDQNSRIDTMIQYLTADGQISLDEETVEKISFMFPVAQYNTNIKKGISYFDIELKDNNLMINGIKIR
ncbi:MAG: hypothetical protein WA945_04625 [Arcobacteraceae bacterium]